MGKPCPSHVAENAVLYCVSNTNAPLVMDSHMSGALKTYARAGQPVADPCFHHWHYVRRLQCFNASVIRSASVEGINGRCIGEGANSP